MPLVKTKTPSKYPNLRPLWMAVFSDIIGFSLLIAVNPQFTILFNITYFQVAFISSINGLFSFISAPIWGRLSDKFGRKPLLQIAQVGTLAGFLILAFANAYWVILLSRIVDGIFGGNFPIAKAAINDVVEPTDMAREMTNIGIAHNFANLFAPALGGILYDHFNLLGPGLAAAFTSLFTLAVTFLKFKETAPVKTLGKDLHGDAGGTEPSPTPLEQKGQLAGQKPLEEKTSPIEGGQSMEGTQPPAWPEEGGREPWYHNRALVRAFFILGISSFGFMTIISNLASYGNKRFGFSSSEMGILLMMTAVIQIITRFTIYIPSLKKWGEYNLAFVGFLLYLVEFLLFAFITNMYQFIVMLVLNSLATSATRGSVSSFVSNLANPWERGKVQGIATSLDTFAQIIGPLIGGAMLTYADIRWFTAVSWGLMLISLVLLVTAKEMHRELSARNKNFKKNGKQPPVELFEIE